MAPAEKRFYRNAAKAHITRTHGHMADKKHYRDLLNKIMCAMYVHHSYRSYKDKGSTEFYNRVRTLIPHVHGDHARTAAHHATHQGGIFGGARHDLLHELRTAGRSVRARAMTAAEEVAMGNPAMAAATVL